MIHSTAIIDPTAKIGNNAEIGPFCIIENDVEIGNNCKLNAYVQICKHTTIGNFCTIRSGAVIGGDPQDLSFSGEISYTEIGDNCSFHEYVTINRGASLDSKTIIGNGVMLMAMSHVAHNCTVGNNVIIANNTPLAGHVTLDDDVFISGNCAVHQFVRIGRRAMVGTMNSVLQDLPPFCLMQKGAVRGPNVVGLKRDGMAPKTRKELRKAIKIFFFAGLNRKNAIEKICNTIESSQEIEEFTSFINSTKRGVISGQDK